MEQLDMEHGVYCVKQITIMTTWEEEEKTQHSERKKEYTMKLTSEMPNQPTNNQWYTNDTNKPNQIKKKLEITPFHLISIQWYELMTDSDWLNNWNDLI